MPNIRHGRITKTAVDDLDEGTMMRDTELRGFGVRRQKGAPVYFLQKRIGGRIRWLTIGPHGSPWTPDSARKEALRMLGTIVTGTDPATLKRDRLDNPTLNDALPNFLEEHGPKLKPTSREKYEILLRLYLQPAFGTHRLRDITRQDVVRFHSRLAKKRSTANYAVAILSKILSWAELSGYRPEKSNPCFGLTKFREVKRQRYLSEEEFARLGAVLNEIESGGRESLYVVAAIRLLMLTGARVNEILTLKWSYVHTDRKVLLLPDSKTGQKQIILSSAALAVLEAIPEVKGNPYVIIGRFEESNLVNIQKVWRRIRKLANLEDARLHDLRHSFASMAAANGGSLPMIGKLLGHNHTMTTARYAHLADDPTRELTEKVGEAIAKAAGKTLRTEAQALAANDAEMERLRTLLAEAEKLKADSQAI